MIVLENKISKKYAVAFLNIYAKQCFPDNEEIITKFAKFVSTQRLFQVILSLPSLSVETKDQLIHQVSKKLNLPPCIQKLMLLLLKHKRIELLAEILKKILLLNKLRENKYHFNVETSHELNNEEQIQIINFIKTFIKHTITTSFAINTDLISGIKIEGNSLLFERSIAKKLRNVEQTILRRKEI